MSDRYIPREGRPLEPSELMPTTPRARHIIDKMARFIDEMQKEGHDVLFKVVDIWRITKVHSTCDMGD